jgi:4-hydroxybenzoate polyprenyltransferase/geranylgeranylglycerol-phosphate geranylgeranyltransferase
MASFEQVRTKALAHLEMTRPYTVFHAGLLAIAASSLAAAGHVPAWRVALAAAVTMCGWEAGLYASDYYDRELDAHSKPDRPVPSGRVSPREARLTMVGLIAAGYLAALVLGIANFALAVLTTALGLAYAKIFKGQAILGNFDRGVLGACAVLFGAFAGGNPWQGSVLLLAAMVFFHDSATNLVGAMRDVDGDRAGGYATVPVVYGLATAVRIAGLLTVAWLALGTSLVVLLRPNCFAAGLFAAGVLLAVGVYGDLWRARHRVTRPGALRAHKVLVLERLLLMSGIIAVFTPAWVTLALLGTSVTATLVSQAVLRNRGEQEKLAQWRNGWK